MTKSDLINHVSHERNIPAARAESIVNAIFDSIETTLKLSTGIVTVLYQAKVNAGTDKANEQWVEATFSESFACASCGISFQELEPRLFSFNSPYGACPACSGLGEKIDGNAAWGT